jgi:hypothetical protein
MSGQAPAVVKVRALGEPGDIDALAAVLTASRAVEVIDRTGPRPNRYDPGVRVYLTLLIHQEAQQ